MSAAATQYTFSGHETFPFRYPWFKKGYDAVCEDGDVFLRDDAITTLGVGKNMVRSIRHWCLTAGIIEANQRDDMEGGSLRPTKLGRLLFADKGLDPYLEDPATLWLIHWQLASHRYRASTWFWSFSYYHEPEFTRDSLTAALAKWTGTLGGKKVASSSVRHDVEVFVRSYVPSRSSRGKIVEDSLDCPLAELGLIVAGPDGQTFAFRRGSQESLPNGIVLFATLAFWEALDSAPQTLSISDLARLPGSPGRLFKIDESSLIDRYSVIEDWTDGAVSYDETAGLKQLYRRRRLVPMEALGSAYAVRRKKR
jgi:hypothetical protein